MAEIYTIPDADVEKVAVLPEMPTEGQIYERISDHAHFIASTVGGDLVYVPLAEGSTGMSLAQAVVGQGGAFKGMAFFWSNDATTQNRSITTAQVDYRGEAGNGIRVEEWVVGTNTYLGFHADSGIYLLFGMAPGNTGPNFQARYSGTFPTTAGGTTSHGSDLDMAAGSVNNSSARIFSVNNFHKIWCYQSSSNEADLGYILFRLA